MAAQMITGFDRKGKARMVDRHKAIAAAVVLQVDVHGGAVIGRSTNVPTSSPVHPITASRTSYPAVR